MTAHHRTHFNVIQIYTFLQYPVLILTPVLPESSMRHPSCFSNFRYMCNPCLLLKAAAKEVLHYTTLHYTTCSLFTIYIFDMFLVILFTRTKELPILYGIQRYVTMCTRACQVWGPV